MVPSFKISQSRQRLSGAVGGQCSGTSESDGSDFQYQVPRTLYVKLSQKAQATGRTLAGYVTMALHDLIKRSQ